MNATLIYLLLCQSLVGTVHSIEFVTRIANGNDDAEQRVSDGFMLIGSNDLGMTYDNKTEKGAKNSGGDQIVGLRFQKVAVPQGAKINGVHIEFIADEAQSTTTSLTIRGQASDDASTFTKDYNDMTRRPKTSSSVDWGNVPAWTVGATKQSPDLTTIVQEIVDRPGWSFGNAIVFFITGSGRRTAESYEGDSTTAPLLKIDYSVGNLVPKGPVSTPIPTPPAPAQHHAPSTIEFETRIESGDDDAEERVRDGFMLIGSNDLGMTFDDKTEKGGKNTAGDQKVGLRFQRVTVPRAAHVVGAHIEFSADETQSTATSITIRGQASDDASTFTKDQSDMTRRPKTSSSVDWDNIPSWTTGTTQRSPDLTRVVQEIVNRPGWSPGNAVVFVITGSGRRTAVSYEGDRNKSPLLRVYYNPYTDPPTDQPTKTPTERPTRQPTKAPTPEPSPLPTKQPIDPPTDRPTAQPTQQTTDAPTDPLTDSPTHPPSCIGYKTDMGCLKDDPVPLGQAGQWNLIFSDEFDGSGIDLSKWETAWFSNSGYTKPVSDLEECCYHPSQVSVVDGNLNLKTQAHMHPDCIMLDGSRASYVSGLVNTRNSFTFTSGYIEARIWIDGDAGSFQAWPSFRATGFAWPKGGAIDIMDVFSFPGQPCFGYHWGSPDTHESFTKCANLSNTGGWHTFGVLREEGKITAFYDGVKLASHSQWVTAGPHFLVLNQGMKSQIQNVDLEALLGARQSQIVDLDSLLEERRKQPVVPVANPREKAPYPTSSMTDAQKLFLMKTVDQVTSPRTLPPDVAARTTPPPVPTPAAMLVDYVRVWSMDAPEA